MKRSLHLLLLACTFFSAIFFSGCHDSIFESIENEIALDKSGIRGSMGSIVEYGGNLYITPMHKGEIFRKSATAREKGGWESISAPKTPIAITNDGGTLYLLAADWVEGTGDYEGYNVPAYFEYTSNDGTSWAGPVAQHSYDKDSNNVPARYKNQCCSVTTGGHTYSIPSSYTTEYISTPTGSKKVCDGYIFSITATANTVIVGTELGIYSLPIESGGSLGTPTTHVGDSSKDASSTFTSHVPIVYVPNGSRTKNESAAVIYAYNSPRGSSGTQNEGLMAYFPGSGWNRDR